MKGSSTQQRTFGILGLFCKESQSYFSAPQYLGLAQFEITWKQANKAKKYPLKNPHYSKKPQRFLTEGLTVLLE